MKHALLVSVFVLATCGLVYELIAGAAASYLLGDSVTQFSTIIGAYLFSMGIGSWLSRYVGRGLIARFIQIEILVGVVGGLSSTILFVAFGQLPAFRLILYAVVALIGIGVGMEIPLLLRILKDQLQFKDLVAQVLSLDYVGALAASILFPIWLVPHLGLIRTSFLFGIANIGVALWTTWLFREHLPAARFFRVQGAAALVLLAAGFAGSAAISDFAEEGLYADEIIFFRTTAYQKIVVTREADDVRLYLNGHLQFSSRDEYRYHEALVHPGLAAVADPGRVLVLGGGDGLAVREILKDPRVREVRLVDLDPEMTRIFRDHASLSQLNGGALRSPKLRVTNADAFLWLEEAGDRYDFVVVDFPDPTNYSLSKLYTTSFYRRLARRLAEGGIAVIQSTSPLFARKSFWCIAETVRAAGLQAAPYHVYVPSFGEWGFVLASREAYRPPERFPEGLRFVSAATSRSFFEFPPDMAPVPVEANRLNHQVLVQYYDSEWKTINP
ncbi:MAG: polyamine aminopropyltransferase [Planctomycetes bacterium]|nr:polyamine aminopropyltransferase [Planctomycetota bacterium]